MTVEGKCGKGSCPGLGEGDDGVEMRGWFVYSRVRAKREDIQESKRWT
jgi:hypothetical protein